MKDKSWIKNIERCIPFVYSMDFKDKNKNLYIDFEMDAVFFVLINFLGARRKFC